MLKKNIKVVEGSGFLAKKFKKHSFFLNKQNVIIYAAGVSNSQEKNATELQREIRRFKTFSKQNNKKIVYISTYSIFDKSRNRNKYIKNKVKIELLIKKNLPSYLIVRLPEIVGFNKNPNTLINFFYQKIINRKKFTVWSNTKRNLLDVDDAIKIIIYFIKIYENKNKTLNLLNKKFYKPLRIVRFLENMTNIKGDYKILKKKTSIFKITNSINSKIINKLKLKFDSFYLNKTLKKYYK
tara:strand:- start:4510 stop:5226 length:717 start_codon:yes stop_codon:yes gene_type:complete